MKEKELDQVVEAVAKVLEKRRIPGMGRLAVALVLPARIASGLGREWTPEHTKLLERGAQEMAKAAEMMKAVERGTDTGTEVG